MGDTVGIDSAHCFVEKRSTQGNRPRNFFTQTCKRIKVIEPASVAVLQPVSSDQSLRILCSAEVRATGCKGPSWRWLYKTNRCHGSQKKCNPVTGFCNLVSKTLKLSHFSRLAEFDFQTLILLIEILMVCQFSENVVSFNLAIDGMIEKPP